MVDEISKLMVLLTVWSVNGLGWGSRWGYGGGLIVVSCYNAACCSLKYPCLRCGSST